MLRSCCHGRKPSVEKFRRDFCRSGYEVKAEPWHKTANNWFGHIFGYVHKVPGILKSMYRRSSRKILGHADFVHGFVSAAVISGNKV